jgi:outer membrane receptor for ferrienterochelin and colicin
MSQPENISNSLRTGFELKKKKKISDWWKVDGNFTFYNVELNATNLEKDLKSKSNHWSIRANSVMSFNKIFETQLSGHYRSKMLRAQGESKSNWNLDASFKYNVTRSLSFSLRVQDIFNTRQRSSWYEIPGVLYSDNSWNMRSRSYFIGMMYRFHDLKQRTRDRQDEEQRTDTDDNNSSSD